MFRVFGIQLAVHASFFLLLAYVGYQGWVEGQVPGMLWSVALIVVFFICVVLHELGHSLTAKRYGIRVPRILLLPIGGMAQFERIPRKPSQELLITIAGPAVNFLIAAVLFVAVWRGLINTTDIPRYSLNHLIDELWFWNLLMGAFNLLPVFPMDGGRILRALLAFRLPYLRATWWAALVSKILAPTFACIAFFILDWKMVGVLFLFILFAGDAEYKQTLRLEQEEQYWRERVVRPVVSPPGDDEPRPPPRLHGPN